MEFHFLNVTPGACTVIKHDDGRITVVDICNGNDVKGRTLEQPIEYLRLVGAQLGRKVLRFVLTHPDLDHMDGLLALWSEYGFFNFWHNNILPPRNILADSQHRASDYDLFGDLMLGRLSEECNVISVRSGYSTSLSSRIEVLSPSASLQRNADSNTNDASLVLLLTTAHGDKILLSGDVGLRVWQEMLADAATAQKLKEVDVVVAPHHGRASAGVGEVLPVLEPQLVLIGNADSEYVDYSAWRGYAHLHSSQAGTIILEDGESSLLVYVTNFEFAAVCARSEAPRRHSKYEAWLVAALPHRHLVVGGSR